MLNETIKALRRSKDLSQQKLAAKVNVVRQIISKWERGLLVPGSDLLIVLSKVPEIPANTLLGEIVTESEMDEVRALSEKLEIIDLQFTWKKAVWRAASHWLLIAVCGGTLAVVVVLAAINSPYLDQDYSAPKTTVMGVVTHAFEWGSVRLAPFTLIVATVGAFLMRKKHRV